MRAKKYHQRLQIEEDIPETTAEELHSRLTQDEPMYIFDSRTTPEFQAALLTSAYYAQGGQVALLAPEIVHDKNHTIVTTCAGRTRSLLGAHVLRRMGFSNVYALKGGTGPLRIVGHAEELEKDDGAPLPQFFETSLTARKKLAEELAKEDHNPSLNSTELRVRQDSGELLYLLDVHVLDEYQTGHSNGAHFCPDPQVALLTESPVAVKNTLFITVCLDRAGAIMAVAQLTGAGYPNASTLDGGTTAWIQDCHPLETGAPKEICFGQRVGLARLLQGLPAGVERQVLPIFGLVEAAARAEPLTPQTLQAGLTAGERPTRPDVRSAGTFATAQAPGRAVAVARKAGYRN